MVSTMTSVEKVKIPEGYKQTEVGVIPTDWDLKPLVSLCKIIDGDRGNNYPNGNDFISDGFCVFLSATNVTKKGFKFKAVSYISKAKDKVLRQGKLKRGDIVLTTRGSVGHFSYYNDSVYFEHLRINSGMVIVRNESPNIGNDYLYSILSSPFIGNQIETMSFGSALPQLTVRDINGFYLCFPKDKQEQTAIANALSDVDNLIASLETLIAKKSAIKTAAMQQLLTGKKRLPAFVKESEKQSSELDNTSETAQATQTKQTSTLNSDLYKKPSEGLDTKSNQHSDVGNANNKQTAPRPGYKQTELGEIPEDWEVRVLGESLSIMHGRDQKQVECADGKFPILGTGGEMGRTDSYLYNKPSVLIGRKGSINKPRYMDSPFWTVDTLFYSQVSEKFNAKFIFYKFCMIDWMSYNEASGVPSLNSSTIESVMQVFPETREEQTAIANVLSDMDTELEALQQRLNKTKTIKQGMMQELLTGKTRLV